MARRSSALTSIATVAQTLGENEDWLWDLALDMEPEDGMVWVTNGEEEILCFNEDGIDYLKQLIEDNRQPFLPLYGPAK